MNALYTVCKNQSSEQRTFQRIIGEFVWCNDSREFESVIVCV